MTLVLAPDGTIEYDLTEELLELEVDVLLDALLLDERDSALLVALKNSPWEMMQAC